MTMMAFNRSAMQAVQADTEAKLNKQISDYQSIKNELQRELAVQRAELQAAQQELSNAQRELSSAQSALSRAQAMSTSTPEARSRRSAAIAAAQSRISAAQTRIANAQNRIAKAEQEIALLEQEIEITDAAVEVLQEGVKDSRMQMQALMDTVLEIDGAYQGSMHGSAGAVIDFTNHLKSLMDISDIPGFSGEALEHFLQSSGPNFIERLRIGMLIARMLLAQSVEERQNLIREIAHAIANSGLAVSATSTLLEFPFFIDGALLKYSVDVALKSGAPAARTRLEVEIARQLENISLSVELSGIIASVGEDGINFGATVDGVTVTWDFSKMLPPLYILSGKFEGEATNNDFASVSAAMEIDKRMPGEEPKPKHQPNQLPGFAPNPAPAPIPAEVEKKWWEKGWEAIKGGASDAWDGAKDFYSNNREVIEIAAACVVIVGLTALAVKTLGASTTVTSSGYAAAFATLATAFA